MDKPRGSDPGHPLGGGHPDRRDGVMPYDILWLITGVSFDLGLPIPWIISLIETFTMERYPEPIVRKFYDA